MIASHVDLVPTSRRPTTLADATAAAALALVFPAAPAEPSPRVSVVIATHDGLAFTRLCLRSVLDGGDSLEVIVVDNASSDGTREFLLDLAERDGRIRPILNDENRGFAAATNQGLAAARADVLVLLNNDTVVTPGWVARLRRDLGDEGVGLVGPLTNRSGSEAEIPTTYSTYGELLELAGELAARPPRALEVERLTMFCCALRRDTYERVGPLDERFGIGLFEDDDYCLRVRSAGLRVVIAEDAFVHHLGQGTIGDPGVADFGALYHANARRFTEKWGRPPAAPRRRPSAAYDALVARVREQVAAHVPENAKLIVVSKGDPALIDLPAHRAAHFPQGGDGEYAGYHPADSAEAIAQLEAHSPTFFVVPATFRWWLEQYDGLRTYLEQRARAVTADDSCAIYELR